MDENRELSMYLDLIDHDMRENPSHVRPLSADLLRRADDLVGHITVDLDEDLGDEVSLP